MSSSGGISLVSTIRSWALLETKSACHREIVVSERERSGSVFGHFFSSLIISTHLRASELFMRTLSAPYLFLANIHQSGSTLRTTAVGRLLR